MRQVLALLIVTVLARPLVAAEGPDEPRATEAPPAPPAPPLDAPPPVVTQPAPVETAPPSTAMPVSASSKRELEEIEPNPPKKLAFIFLGAAGGWASPRPRRSTARTCRRTPPRENRSPRPRTPSSRSAARSPSSTRCCGSRRCASRRSSGAPSPSRASFRWEYGFETRGDRPGLVAGAGLLPAEPGRQRLQVQRRQ